MSSKSQRMMQARRAADGRTKRAGGIWRALLASLVLLVAPATLAAQETQVVEFTAGWNLMAVSVDPVDPDPSVVFADLELASELESLWTYDTASGSWSRYPAATVGYPEITEIVAGKGYWIKVLTGDVDLVVEGDPLAAGESDLESGWNLMGVATDEAHAYDRFFEGSDLRQLWTYDPTAGGFLGIEIDPSGVILRQDFDEVEPGRGYWALIGDTTTVMPVLGTSAPADIDVAPLVEGVTLDGRVSWDGGMPGPGDLDMARDGFYDRPRTQRGFDFGTNQVEQNLYLFNDYAWQAGASTVAAGVLRWRATISYPDPQGCPATARWLSFRIFDEESFTDLFFDELEGSLTTGTETLRLFVDRTGILPTETSCKARVHIESNGSAGFEAVRDFDVYAAVAPFDGDYEVLARIQCVDALPVGNIAGQAPVCPMGGRQADLHNPRLYVSIWEDGDGLKGVIDDYRSLLFPQKVFLSGEIFDESRGLFSLSGTANLPSTSPYNPYQDDVTREFTFFGRRSNVSDASLGPLDLTGEFRETIRGALAEPMYLAGIFDARLADSEPSGDDRVRVEDTETLDIPDGDGPGCELESVLSVTEHLILTEVDVSIAVEHTRPEDLRIAVTSPSGTEVVLRDSDPTFFRPVVYDETAAPLGDLEDFNGEMSDGDWTLCIDDQSAGETGSILDWALELRGTELYALSGQVPVVLPGAYVLITGCGVAAVAETDAGGNYSFEDLSPCDYRLTLVADGYSPETTQVRLEGGDAVVDLDTPTVIPPSTLLVNTAPTCDPLASNCGPTGDQPCVCADGHRAIFNISNLASASYGKECDANPADLSCAQAWHDSATQDVDRPPCCEGSSGNCIGTPGSCTLALGDEDTNAFLDSLGGGGSPTGTNDLGSNLTLDAPLGMPHYRLAVSLGGPIIGHASSKGQQLRIGMRR